MYECEIMVIWYALTKGFAMNADVLVTVQPPSSVNGCEIL